MHKGYIYLWRKILETSFYNQPLVAHLAIHLLLRANYTTKEIIVSGHPLSLSRGQLIAGREALSSKTGLSEQQVRTALKKLQMVGFLTIKSTKKFSLITICKYDLYQNKESYINQKPHQQPLKNQPTANQAATTDNKDNNENKEVNNANFIYAYYKKLIRNGGQLEAVASIVELLKSGHSKEQLIKAVNKYKAQINKEGIEDKYRNQANNFFKPAGKVFDYLCDDVIQVIKFDPNCRECYGTGKIFSPGTGKNVDCFVCIKNLVDGSANSLKETATAVT